MKINILTKKVDTPSGGGNQFLKALRNEFITRNIYEETPENADIILFNSFNFIEDGLFFKLLKLKKMSKILVHRVDGPISLYRGRDEIIDQIIYTVNQSFASATVFQSNWSRTANYKLGLQKNDHECTIMNAPDNNIFNTKNKEKQLNSKYIKLIATSWSNNLNKGFDIYAWLDKNLNFSKYEMTFIGNSPIEFLNIKHIPALNSNELAMELKKADIYITASKKDPCSNSLIEALHCGLPALAYNDGGHPEIISSSGKLFTRTEEILPALQKLVENYDEYQKSIHLPDIRTIATEYINFFSTIKKTETKPVDYLAILSSIFKYYYWKVKNKLW